MISLRQATQGVAKCKKKEKDSFAGNQPTEQATLTKKLSRLTNIEH